MAYVQANQEVVGPQLVRNTTFRDDELFDMSLLVLVGAACGRPPSRADGRPQAAPTSNKLNERKQKLDFRDSASASVISEGRSMAESGGLVAQ